MLLKSLEMPSPPEGQGFDPKRHLDVSKFLTVAISSWYGRLAVDAMMIVLGKVNFTTLLPGNGGKGGSFPRTPQAEGLRVKLREVTAEMISVLKDTKSSDRDRTQAQVKYREAHLRYSVLRFEIYLIQRRSIFAAITTLLKGTTWSFVSQAISEEAAATQRQLSANHQQMKQSDLLNSLQVSVGYYKECRRGTAWDWITGLEANTSIEPNSSACTNVVFDVDEEREREPPVDVRDYTALAERMRRLTKDSFQLRVMGGGVQVMMRRRERRGGAIQHPLPLLPPNLHGRGLCHQGHQGRKLHVLQDHPVRLPRMIRLQVIRMLNYLVYVQE